MLDKLLDLMAHASPHAITAGSFPHSDAVARAPFHPTRTAFLHFRHSGIARAISVDTVPRAGHGC